jgi:ubiquinone/menaquinone biosynthesis C-methylase UbiE
LSEEKIVSRPDIFIPDDKINLEAFENHLARYAFAAEFVVGKIVLDIACSWGYGSRFLRDKNASLVIGGDISTEAVECAQKYWSRQGMAFITLDVISLPFADNSFDVIVSMETIEHLEKYEDYLNECQRVLKGGGMFICSTPYKGYGVPGIVRVFPSHIHEFYPEEFQAVLSQFFTEVRLYGQDYWQKGEMEAWGRKYNTAMMVKTHIPKLYEILEFFYVKLIARVRYIQLNQIDDWDKILSEKYKPSPLGGDSPIPKQIIALARK